jgi:hypothetical protein
MDANRLNSQKSTGPRSDEGKANSKFNALKHGIDAASAVIPGEDPAEREALLQDYYRRFQPENPDEKFLVDALIDAHWNRQRYAAIETQLMNKMLAGEHSPSYPLAALFDPENPAAPLLERVIRHREAAERAWHRAFNALTKMHEVRQTVNAARTALRKPPERTRFEPALPIVPSSHRPENLHLRL